LELIPERNGEPPIVVLDPVHYKLVDGLEKMLRRATPGLRRCRRLTVSGPVAFSPGVFLAGEVEFNNPGPQEMIVKPGVHGS
jgi:hypothetical protein